MNLLNVPTLMPNEGATGRHYNALVDAVQRALVPRPASQPIPAPIINDGFKFLGFRRDGSGNINGVKIGRGCWQVVFPDDRPVSNGPARTDSETDSGEKFYTLDITEAASLTVYVNLKWQEATDYDSDPVTFTTSALSTCDFWHWQVKLFDIEIVDHVASVTRVYHTGDIITHEYVFGFGENYSGHITNIYLSGTELKFDGFDLVWIRPGGILYGNGSDDFVQGATPTAHNLFTVDIAGT